MPATAALSFIQPSPTPLVTVKVSGGAVGLATADFNGDGKPDLAVTFIDDVGAGQQGFVAVMLGNGDGSFQAPAPLYTLSPGVFARGILARDFDRDGKLDLAVAVGESRQILFFKGHGNGVFDAAVVTSTTHRPQGLQTADLNGDGILDLVTLNPDDNTVSVLLGVGNGTFQAPTDYPAGSNPLDVAIGDVDGLNRPDLVVGSYATGAVGVLLNNGNGTFASMVSFNAKMKPQGLYLADFDGDGKLDVVAAGNDCNGGNVDSSGCMVFMKGQGNGSFTVPLDQNFTGIDSIPIRRFTENFAPDLNGDGKPDVVFVPLQPGGFGKSEVMVGLNKGDGTGTFNVSYWVGGILQPVAGANPDFVTGIAALPADFDKDGVLDLVFATVGKDNTRGGVSILFGDTPGTFDVPRSYPGNYKGFSHGPPARGGVFGDFTGDGKIDLVVVDAGTDGFVASPMLDTFRGNGDGTLRDAITALPWDPHNSGSSSTLRSADLDKNGTLDLVFFGPQSGIVASGNGNGTFTAFGSFGYAAGVAANMVLADFNGDGFPDLAIFEGIGCFFPNASTQIEILLQGSGGTKTFASKSILPVNGICGGGTALVAADFDKDGKVDLLVPLGNNTNGTNASALFFKGNGDGTFQASSDIGTGLPTIFDYAAADLNNDGKLDLIGVGGGAVYIQLGNGNGTFQAPVPYGVGGFCGDSRCGVKIADFDGDGIPDIAVVISDSFGGFAALRGKGDGTFEPPVRFAVGATGAAWLDIADVDGDGLPDVVVGHSGDNGNGYTVLLNDSKPPSADLAISKSDSPDPVTVGNPLTYTITVRNNGPSAATGVMMTDSLPATLTLVSAISGQGNCTGTATVTCNLGTLSNGGSVTVTIVVTPTQVGGISNTATVTAAETDPDASNNSATEITTINPIIRQLSALGPANLWVGQGGRNKKLKFDLLAEVFVNSQVVGTGQLSNVNSGTGSFKKAVFDSMSLALGASTAVPPGATLSLRASVRVSCATNSTGISGTATLWYNGKPVDTGKRKDAGSRLNATIGGTNSSYFLRTALALATTAGTSKQSINVAVNDAAACPGRPFTSFGTWSVNLP
jgi:uncharacterized repeat protein (TIGR01451 family)